MKCVATNCAASAARGMPFWKDPYTYLPIYVYIYIKLVDDKIGCCELCGERRQRNVVLK